jgi:hypothetical protein
LDFAFGFATGFGRAFGSLRAFRFGAGACLRFGAFFFGAALRFGALGFAFGTATRFAARSASWIAVPRNGETSSGAPFCG